MRRVTSLYFLSALLLLVPAFGFLLPRQLAASTRSSHTVVLGSFMKQKPGESDKEFFKRIQQAASDPVAFERMALGKDEKQSQQTNATDEGADGTPKQAKTGYVRAEEWEEQMKAKRKKGEMTWEEKVQFEGQRYGNQFNQNEILRKNLKAF